MIDMMAIFINFMSVTGKYHHVVSKKTVSANGQFCASLSTGEFAVAGVGCSRTNMNSAVISQYFNFHILDVATFFNE
ncbi:hypothetical protein PU634_14830 [Oceanimonas pelagia]|uniref:Uncharacterized protein n=1 Tax=Oceanimonas pelagia TaxID=3028314 RepID=A0AA50KMM1_9GAMM|nr:hypothetical protein [Oceanimonas pelagia]WMC10333.1 hypothetical protein PU634_14830 [Oceanimonas pelagia]